VKQRVTTLFLKIAVILTGVPVLALCIFVLPSVAREAAGHYLLTRWLYPVLIGMYASAIPFSFALYQALKLLSYIDTNRAFSDLSVKALKNIKYCAATIAAFFVVLMPPIFVIAEGDDAPGLAAIALLITFGSMVIAVFAAVLEELLKNAIDIKSENDLTV